MCKRACLIWFCLICLLPVTALGQQEVRVMVMPFSVHAMEDMAYLANEIPAALKKHLQQEGALIVDAPADAGPATGDAAALRKIAVDSGADQVIWGSMTWVGRRFSVDMRLADAVGTALPQSFFKEGQGIENLADTVKDLGRAVGLKLFAREMVADIVVTGNRRIESEAVKRAIKTKVGDMYSPLRVSEDLKAVHAMGYFDDIRIESETVPTGRRLIFKVVEKSTIRMIRFKGNIAYDDDKLKESLTISTGAVLNEARLQENVKRIEDLYKGKNYHGVKVAYNLKELENNQSDVEFAIEEGSKMRIKNIFFEGNTVFSDKQLKKQMRTSEKGFFSWITSSGELNQEDLNADAGNIAAFYMNNGYIQAKVGDPQVVFQPEWIDIAIKIEEGPRYKVGAVDIKGDLIRPKDELLKKLKIAKEPFFSREVVRNDVLALTDLYSDDGYAYAEVFPQVGQNVEQLTVDITYNLDKGSPVFFEKIIISGNTRTRDKVIRRELNVYEQELYRGQQLKKGVRNLHRLEYFEDVKVDTQKGSADDKMVLKVDVKEKPTGAFTVGGGYSSMEDFFFMASVSQRNLFGRGQELTFKGMLGGRSDRYTLSFTEPWLFDIPLTAGIDLYNWSVDWDTYEKESRGGAVRLSYPIFDYTRLIGIYGYEVTNITDVTAYAPRSIKELLGENATSKVTGGIVYDSRDRLFNPTEGANHLLTVEYAGLGGDIAFTKTVGEAGWYIPLYKSLVGFVHGKAGYVDQGSDGKLPDYERFYLGGINSLRGFDWRDVHVIDTDGTVIGGDKFVQGNVELIFPLFKTAGLMGVVFFDTGNVYATSQNVDLGNLRESAGFGIRWYSPLGPIRLENGYILDPRTGESNNGRWQFTMGAAF